MWDFFWKIITKITKINNSSSCVAVQLLCSWAGQCQLRQVKSDVLSYAIRIKKEGNGCGCLIRMDWQVNWAYLYANKKKRESNGKVMVKKE